jgi:hypothetical protein
VVGALAETVPVRVAAARELSANAQVEADGEGKHSEEAAVEEGAVGKQYGPAVETQGEHAIGEQSEYAVGEQSAKSPVQVDAAVEG